MFHSKTPEGKIRAITAVCIKKHHPAHVTVTNENSIIIQVIHALIS